MYGKAGGCMTMERQPRGSFSEWKTRETIFFTRKPVWLPEVGPRSRGEAQSPGAGELSPAGSRGGGGRRCAGRPGRAGGFRIPSSAGSEKWGRGDSREGRRPRATPYGYAFPLRALQLPAAPARTFSHRTPRHRASWPASLTRPWPRLGVEGVRRGSGGREGWDPKRKRSPPS